MSGDDDAKPEQAQPANRDQKYLVTLN